MSFLKIFLLGFILSIILTWPYITKLDNFYSDTGDIPAHGYFLWYNQQAIITGEIFNQESYFNANHYFPYQYTLAYGNFDLGLSVIFAPIFWISNDLIFSTNLTIFLSIVLCFIVSFYCLRYLTDNTYASLIGSLIYTFNPLSFSHFPGHLEYGSKLLILPIFTFLYQFLKSPSIKNSLSFFGTITLLALSCFVLFVFCLIGVVISSLPIIFYNIFFKKYSLILNYLKFGLLIMIFIPIYYYFYYPFYYLSQNENTVRNIRDNDLYSARVLDWVISVPNNYLYGEFSKSFEDYRKPKEGTNFNYSEHTLSLNIIPLLLFILGILLILKFPKKSRPLPKIYLISFGLLILTTIIFTFGPFWGGWNNQWGSYKLPYYYLFEYIPLVQGIRAPSRFQYLFYMPFSLICCYGVIYLQKKLPQYFLIIFVAIFGLISLENFNIHDFSNRSLVIPKVKTLEEEGKIDFLYKTNTLHLPAQIPNVMYDAKYFNWLTITQENILNGYGSFTPEDLSKLLRNFNQDLSQPSLNKMRALKIDYLIIHKGLLEDTKPSFDLQSELLKPGIRYEDSEFLIIDIQNVSQEIKYCSLTEDFKIQPFNINLDDKDYPSLSLENQSDCYLLSQKEDRYLKDKFKIKLPLLISPKERVYLSELTGDFKTN